VETTRGGERFRRWSLGVVVIRFIVLVCRRASERGGALKDATTDVFDVSRGVRHD
jgi:hypothetical protein